MRALAANSLLVFCATISAAAPDHDAVNGKLRDRQELRAARSVSRLVPNTIISASTDYWVLIPAAGNVQGAFGTHFKSDVMISNHRGVPQDVDISFCQQGQRCTNGWRLTTVTVPANGTLYLDDIVGKTLGLSGLGTLDLTARTADGDLDFSGRIDVFSRIWTPMANAAGTPFAGGTSSQSFPSVAIDSVSGTGKATILGLRQDAEFRSNIGIYNDDIFADHTFTVQIVGTAAQTTFNITVPAWSMTQTSIPAGNFGNFMVIITPDAGMSTEWWAAYGSSVDNITGDGWVSIASQND